MLQKLIFVLVSIFIIAGCEQTTDDASPSSFAVFFQDDFNRTDNASNLGSDWTIATGTDGCEVSSNKALCKSTGGSSGKAILVTASTASSHRITGTLSISGGNYAGSGSGAFLVLGADNTDLASATYFLACGLNEGSFIIRDNSTVLATGSASGGTDGHSYSFTFTQDGTSVTCSIAGSATDSITHTLTSAPTGGYSGFISGWYDSANKNYAFWDDFVAYQK